MIHGPEARAELFAPVVAEKGHVLDEWSFLLGTPPPRPLDSYDAVLVFGGAMHADEDESHPWLAEETAWLAGLLERGVPTLGICLGVQLLARASGAWVGRAKEPEIGWYGVELTDAGAADPVLGCAAALVRRAAVALLHVRASGGRGRAGAEPGVHAGVPPRRRVLGRAVPSGGDERAARGLARRQVRSGAGP